MKTNGSGPAFMYLPACLMSQTGGLSTFFPLIALTSSGSSAVPTEATSATASEAPPIHKSSQFLTLKA